MTGFAIIFLIGLAGFALGVNAGRLIWGPTKEDQQ